MVLVSLKKELNRVHKLTVQARKKLGEVSEEHKMLSNKKNTMDQEIKSAIEESDKTKLNLDSVHRKYDDACREKEILKKSINKAIDVSQATKDLLLIYENYKV